MLKATKRLITRREAAGEPGFSVRQVRRLLYALKKVATRALCTVCVGSHRTSGKSVEEEAIRFLPADLHKGFGPTLVGEYLAARHDIEVAKRQSGVGWCARSCNMKPLWSYLEKFGRPPAFCTDKAKIFQTAEKRRRDEPGADKDPVKMPPNQIGRALRLHRGAKSAGERKGGEEFRNGTGPFGERHADGGRRTSTAKSHRAPGMRFRGITGNPLMRPAAEGFRARMRR